MDEGNCSKRGAAKVVWTYAGAMAGVPETIQSGAGEEERADDRIEASGENARNADASIWREGQGT